MIVAKYLSGGDDMLESNKKAIMNRYKGLYEKLALTNQDECEDIEYKDNKLYYKDIEIDQDGEIKEKVKSFDVIFVYGTGRFNLIKKLREKFKKTLIIAIELNLCTFKTTLENIDISSIINDPLIFIITPSEDNLDFDIKTIVKFFRQRIDWANIYKFVVPGIKEAKLFDVSKLNQTIEKHLAPILLNRNTLMRHSQRITKNTIKNILSFVRGGFIESIYNARKKKPAIIVASGPSLSKNIGLLKEVQDSVTIIAVDSVMKTLEEYKIKADIVCGVDYQEINLGKYSMVQRKKEKLDTLFVHADGIYYEIPKLFKDTLSDYTDSSFAYLYVKDIGERKLSRFGINAVTHLAIHVAYIIGANPIIFIGQDWAYSSGMEHAEGASIDGSIKTDIIWVKGNYEEKVPSTQTLYSGLKLVEDIVQELSKDGFEFINATEGGAYINGTKLRSLKDTVLEYVAINKNKSSIEIKKDLNYAKFIKRTEEISNYLQKIVKDSSRALKMNNQILKKWKQTNNSAVITQQVENINKINNDITNNSTFKSAVTNFYFAEFFNFYQEEMDIEGQDTEQRIKQSIKYFELIKDKTVKAKKYVDMLLDILMLEKEYTENENRFIKNLDNVIRLLSLYFEFGDIYTGLELADKTLNIYSDNAYLYYWKAKLCTLNRFMHKDSLRYFEKALEIDPDFKKAKFDYEVQKKIVPSHLVLAKAEAQRQNFISAKNLVQRALEHEPDNEEVKRWLEVIEEMAKFQKSQERQELLFEQLKLESDTFKEYETVMEFVKKEELDKAYEKLLYLYEKYGAFGDIPFLLGSIMIDRKELDKAEKYLQEAVELIPHQPLVYVALGKLYMLKEDYWNARVALEKALSMNDKLTPEIADALGDLYYEFDEYEKAIKTFEAFLPYSQDKKKTILKIALCYKELGMVKEYNTLMEKINELNSAN